MTATQVQGGTTVGNTGGATATSALAGSGIATAGNLLVARVSAATTRASAAAGLPAGYAIVADVQNAGGTAYVAILTKTAAGGETGASMSTGVRQGIQIEEWNGLQAVLAATAASASFSGTNAPGALTTGVANVNGGGAAFFHIGAAGGAVTGLAATGWSLAADASTGGGGSKVVTLVSGTTTATITPTWTTNRTGVDLLAILAPAKSSGSFLPFFL